MRNSGSGSHVKDNTGHSRIIAKDGVSNSKHSALETPTAKHIKSFNHSKSPAILTKSFPLISNVRKSANKLNQVDLDESDDGKNAQKEVIYQDIGRQMKT